LRPFLFVPKFSVQVLGGYLQLIQGRNRDSQGMPIPLEKWDPFGKACGKVCRKNKHANRGKPFQAQQSMPPSIEPEPPLWYIPTQVGDKKKPDCKTSQPPDITTPPQFNYHYLLAKYVEIIQKRSLKN
jgi:hypothetical protein